MAMGGGITDPSAVIISSRQLSEGPPTVTRRIPPMIPVEWGQEGVFNDRASQEMGGEVYFGCTGVATLQLMAYWKYPSNLNGTYVDWSETIKYTGEAGNRSGTDMTWTGTMSQALPHIRMTISNFTWLLGEEMDMTWGYVSERKGSGALGQDAVNVLKRNGYSASSKQSYNYGTIVSSLDARRPVMISGWSASDGTGGHTWLIDGFLQQSREIRMEYTWARDLFSTQTWITYGTITRTNEFFHNNWGWDSTNGVGGTYGTGNGYYNAGIFDPINSRDLPSNTRASYELPFFLEMWTNIYK